MTGLVAIVRPEFVKRPSELNLSFQLGRDMVHVGLVPGPQVGPKVIVAIYKTMNSSMLLAPPTQAHLAANIAWHKDVTATFGQVADGFVVPPDDKHLRYHLGALDGASEVEVPKSGPFVAGEIHDGVIWEIERDDNGTLRCWSYLAYKPRVEGAGRIAYGDLPSDRLKGGYDVMLRLRQQADATG